MSEIVVADIGGTHARFARARPGTPPHIGEPRTYRIADFPNLQSCWRRYAEEEGEDLPDAAVFAVAVPLWRDEVKFTNSPWTFSQSRLADDLGLKYIRVINDFHAVAYGVSHLPPSHLEPLLGPDQPFPRDGGVTVLGPGTGLGVGLIAYDDGIPHPLATEGAHADFAPLDEDEHRVRAYLATRFPRVSTERLACGPGLVNIWRGLNPDREPPSDADLWAEALEGDDPAAAHALAVFFRVLGSVAGDIALAHGPHAIVIAGGLAQRMRDKLVASDFHARFIAKGRYEDMMRSIPIKIATLPDIGLFGAAHAYREPKA